MKWIILDWTGKRLFPDQEFASFEDGWEFIYTQFPNEEDYPDLFVVKKNIEAILPSFSQKKKN